MTLGQTIRKARAKAGISLRESAKTLGVNPSYVSRIERNAVRPSMRVLERMAKALAIDADALCMQAGYLPPSMRRNRRGAITRFTDKRMVRESGVEYGTSVYRLSGPRVIEAAEFPFERISDVAEMESWRKELNRPIYHVHKWWAQRLGSVFRSILLGAFLPQESDVRNALYESHSFDNAVVFDPFMGSGTTLGEALKLGARAIGCDINPVAHFAVVNGLSRHSRTDVMRTYGEIERDVGNYIRRFYRAKLPSGVIADVLYYFWVMQAICPGCRKPVDLFSSYVFATNAAPGRKHQGRAICPMCGKIEMVDVTTTTHKCLHCAGQFSLEKGTVSGAKCTCPYCRQVFAVAENATDRKSPPKYRLYAKLVLDERGNRTYIEANAADNRLFQEASRELGKNKDWYPVVPLSPGYNTDQAMNYGFTYWHHFFNARQLLCLGALARRVRQIPDENLRNLFACLFSGCLEFNNLFASYKGEGTGAVRHMFAHHILKPERMPIEANLWGTPRSSGAFSTLFQSRLMRALEYQNDPFELRVVWRGETKTTEKVHGINHPIGENVASTYRAFARGQRLCLLCGDSSNTDIPDKTVDAVITDPPFFDNVHYSQLADFFYAWHPYLLNGKHHNGRLTTRSEREVQQTDATIFSRRLGDVWRECNRVLRDDGLIVFTYHHSRSEGWSALLASLFAGGFYITAAHPVKSEMSVAAPKQQAREPIDIDMIMVCRKKDETVRPKVEPNPRTVLQESLPAATRAVERMNATGRRLSRNDVRVIVASQVILRLSRLKIENEAQALFRALEQGIETETGSLFSSQNPCQPSHEMATDVPEQRVANRVRNPATQNAAAMSNERILYPTTAEERYPVEMNSGLRTYPSAVRESSKPLVDKLRGGYYTDVGIAKWLCAWAIRTPKDRVLEPSCGEGVFLQCAAECLMSLGREIRWIIKQITGVEIVEIEAQKTKKRLESLLGKRSGFTVECIDFFEWLDVARSQPYDCCIGNPPFIRYHNFPEPSRTRAMALMQRIGLKPNKLTNIWVPFVVAATETLAVDGRLAFVLPAELLQVSYAAQLRTYLSHNFSTLKIHACNEMFFEAAEQEVVLLLAEGKAVQPGVDNKCSITLYETESLNDLLATEPDKGNGNGRPKVVHHQSEKWLKYFLSNYEISLMRELRESQNAVNLSKFAAINIGVVTGENDFFLLSDDDVLKWGLQDYTLPLVGRTAQLRGAIIDKAELAELRKEGHRVLLFYVNPDRRENLDGAAKYITHGEALKVHKGFKCSIRDPWYVVPSVWMPDCFFFRQIYDFPRVVLNRAAATSTDTIHRMKCNVPAHSLLPALYTHLTAASAEIEGRSYGGGVLELEPTEAERLLVPSTLQGGIPVDEIDKLVRDGRLEDVLKAHDKTILSTQMGISSRDCEILAGIWRKLMNRRRSRGRRKPPPIYESNGGKPL